MAVSSRRSSHTSLGLIILIRFPIREYGMNYESQPLQKHEIVEMKASEEIIQRILRSYRLMLSFYGRSNKFAWYGLMHTIQRYDLIGRRDWLVGKVTRGRGQSSAPARTAQTKVTLSQSLG
jgi:hypothetical protein